jgi:hypothetical protein
MARASVCDNILEWMRLTTPASSDDLLEDVVGATLPFAAVRALNAPDIDLKMKVSVLVMLSNLALATSHRNREIVLDAMYEIDETFERHLMDKEEGSRDFGTHLGSLHVLTMVTLLRATHYKIKASLFLLFVSKDIGIAFTILVAMLKVEEYEDAIAGAVLRCQPQHT